MNSMYILRRLALAIAVISPVFITYTIVHGIDVHLPHHLWHKQLSDSQVTLFANKQRLRPEVGQLVICRQQDGSWGFGAVAKQWPDEYYDIASMDNHVINKHVSLSSIKTLSSVWNQLFNPTVSLEQMRGMLDERINYYKSHGAPDGHGMILSAQSKIVVFGDLHGYFDSLQNHLARMYKDGLLDEQFHLKSNCYVVGLGDYTGDGGEGILVLRTLLKLQENNPEQVFLLRGDHENVSKSQIDGFQKEWYGTFGSTNKDFRLSEMVWLKMLMVWNYLPKLLLVGLQMPSTQSYDFLMFCHGGCDFSWRPDAFLSKVVEKHISQCYKNPCILDYRDDKKSETSFVTGTFADDADIAKMRAKTTTADKSTMWSKSAFAEFVKRFASRIDKKQMYQYCLRAMVRGHEHIPGGIVALKCNGAKTWKALKDNKVYEIDPCSIYTCTSGSHCMSKAGCFDGAFGLIEAGINGHWYITSHLEL